MFKDFIARRSGAPSPFLWLDPASWVTTAPDLKQMGFAEIGS